MAEHNFIWTSNGVANVPNQLLIGVEIVDGMIRIMNQNPDRDEYLMGETKANSSFDFSKVTADWFTAEVTTKDAYTFLNVVFMDPSIDKASTTDEDFENSSNLQILKDGSSKKMDLEMKIHKDMIDPELLDMMKRH